VRALTLSPFQSRCTCRKNAFVRTLSLFLALTLLVTHTRTRTLNNITALYKQSLAHSNLLLSLHISLGHHRCLSKSLALNSYDTHSRRLLSSHLRLHHKCVSKSLALNSYDTHSRRLLSSHLRLHHRYVSKSLTELHAMMLDGSFARPNNASDAVADFLHRLLEVRPADRITIASCWEHPWILSEPADIVSGSASAHGATEDEPTTLSRAGEASVARVGTRDGIGVASANGDADASCQNKDSKRDNSKLSSGSRRSSSGVDSESRRNSSELDTGIRRSDCGSDTDSKRSDSTDVIRIRSRDGGARRSSSTSSMVSRRHSRQPSQEHLNEQVLDDMVSAGIGTRESITASVRSNLCDRLGAEYNLRAISIARRNCSSGGSAARWMQHRIISAPDTRGGGIGGGGVLAGGAAVSDSVGGGTGVGAGGVGTGGGGGQQGDRVRANATTSLSSRGSARSSQKVLECAWMVVVNEWLWMSGCGWWWMVWWWMSGRWWWS
jgi:hypothetical protein